MRISLTLWVCVCARARTFPIKITFPAAECLRTASDPTLNLNPGLSFPLRVAWFREKKPWISYFQILQILWIVKDNSKGLFSVKSKADYKTHSCGFKNHFMYGCWDNTGLSTLIDTTLYPLPCTGQGQCLVARWLCRSEWTLKSN